MASMAEEGKEEEVKATREETVLAILQESQRPGSVPLSKTFCQQGHAKTTTPGPLAEIVRRGREAALDQYLLALAWASGGDHEVRHDSRVWARAIGAAADDSGRAAVSRNWAFLASLKLVTVKRVGRLAQVTLLSEDGHGDEYAHPGETHKPYAKIPFAYWEDGHHESLSLSAKAILLIALTLADEFTLPADRGPQWYGLSPSTVQRGLRELRQAELLKVDKVRVTAPLAPAGFTIVHLYTLRPPFGPKRRARKGDEK